MTIKIIKYDTPAEIFAAMWDMSVDEARGVDFFGGQTANGDKVSFTFDQGVDSIQTQGCWGFTDTEKRTVHIWLGTCSREMVAHMLGHEYAHIIGIDDEFEAEKYGECSRWAMQQIEILHIG